MKSFLVSAILVLLIVCAYLAGKHDAEINLAQKNGDEGLALHAAEGTIARYEYAKTIVKTPHVNSLPLPQANIPLNEIHSLLQQRADAGDGKAACRLAIELLRCRHSRNVSKYFLTQSADMNLLETGDSLKSKLSSENAMDERRLEFLEKNKSCINISDDQYKQAFKYLRQGAYAGEPDALVPYIDGTGLGTNLSFIRDRNFDVWRSDALPLIQSALQQGLPESVVFLSSGYFEDSGLFSALLEDDQYQAEVMRQLYFQLFSVAPTVTDNQLTIEQNRAALRKAKELFASNFRGQVAARSDTTKRLRSAISSKKEHKAPCE